MILINCILVLFHIHGCLLFCCAHNTVICLLPSCLEIYGAPSSLYYAVLLNNAHCMNLPLTYLGDIVVNVLENVVILYYGVFTKR